MLAHTLSTYKDGYKLIVFCSECGQENPSEEFTCVPLPKPELKNIYEKPVFVSGLP